MVITPIDCGGCLCQAGGNFGTLHSVHMHWDSSPFPRPAPLRPLTGKLARQSTGCASRNTLRASWEDPVCQGGLWLHTCEWTACRSKGVSASGGVYTLALSGTGGHLGFDDGQLIYKRVIFGLPNGAGSRRLSP